jgi:hypothetical protein
MNDANQTPGGPQAFRFSRESRIRIDRDGYVWHEGEKVVHDKLARALASWIAIDPETDRYVLRNALDWCFITVDDAPLVVRSVRVHDGARFEVELSDGSIEPLDLATLRIDADDVPYCDVRGGTIPARFSRSAAFTLLEHADADGDRIVFRTANGSVLARRVPRGAGAPHREPAHPE